MRTFSVASRAVAIPGLVLASCVLLLGCRQAEPIALASLDQLLSKSDLYDGHLVSVEACVFATPHGIGIISCQDDKDTLIELQFATGARAEADSEIIMTEVVKRDWASISPFLPMTVTGRFNARKGMSVLVLESATFHE